MWGCSRCRWREKGCKAKRCRPKPGARPDRPSEAASSSQEADDVGSSSDADSAAGAAAADDGSSTHSAERTNAEPGAGAAGARDLKRLKRKISALEDENAQLKAKLAAVAVVVKSN